MKVRGFWVRLRVWFRSDRDVFGNFGFEYVRFDFVVLRLD